MAQLKAQVTTPTQVLLEPSEVQRAPFRVACTDSVGQGHTVRQLTAVV
jgi:hypothetical protein